MKLFEERGVRYLLIGGQAMRLHGMPRFSMDWDLFIPAKDESNLKLINEIMGAQLDRPPLLQLALGVLHEPGVEHELHGVHGGG